MKSYMRVYTMVSVQAHASEVAKDTVLGEGVLTLQ